LSIDRSTMLETFRERQHNHVFDDPFSNASKVMVNRHMAQADQNGLLRAHNAFTPFYGVLHTVRQTDWRTDVENRLAGWLDELENLQYAVEGSIGVAREALKRTRAPYRIESLENLIEYSVNGLAELQAFKRNVSQSHFDLQRHFVFTTMLGVRDNTLENSRRALFFSKLYDLRDSYFYEPAPATLEAYVREYERLIQEPYYFEQVIVRPEDDPRHANVNAELASATLKLDVASLVELVI
jgi:hypothetical protein